MADLPARDHVPLPENAAVDHMRLRVGQRIIEGQIKERVEAKKIYQQAKETGSEPTGLGLISTHTFSAEQMNSMCNSCHAKMSPITAPWLASPPVQI